MATDTVPGYKTSEFWKSLLVVLVGCALILHALIKWGPQSDIELEVGAALAGVQSTAYLIGRSLVKKGTANEGQSSSSDQSVGS